MKWRIKSWAHVAMLLVASVLPRQAHGAGKDVLGQMPPKTDPDLLIHPPNADLSAYRFDTEVFGWSRDFSEVAALGAETWRGPRGKHRGEAFLLTYKVGQTIPFHNVQVHQITHADLPNDPVPIDDVRDMMWAIENSYLAMWPRRPKYKRPKGAMEVEPLWQIVPQGNDLCTPAVGIALTWHGKHRLMPFRPVDLRVNCALLKETDQRTYWGHADAAATMIRFDFSPTEQNERSARFVVAAGWRFAKEQQMVVESSLPLSTALQKELRRKLSKFGMVRFARRPGVSEAADRAVDGKSIAQPVLGVIEVATRDNAREFGAYLGRALDASNIAVLNEGRFDVRVRVGWVQPRKPANVLPTSDLNIPAPSADLKGVASPDPNHAATSATTELPNLPPPPPAYTPPAPPPEPPPRAVYINDFKVP